MKKLILILFIISTTLFATENLQEVSNNIVKKILNDIGPTTLFFTKKSFRDSVTGNILKVSSYLKDEMEVALSKQKFSLKDDLGDAKYLLSVSFNKDQDNLNIYVKYRSIDEMEFKTIKESIALANIPGDAMETTDKIITKSDREKILKTLEKTSKQNEDISKGIKDISQNITHISKLGGIIANPSTPEEYYSNARIYELKGDFVNARKAYMKYFSYKLDYIDPHINYSKLLRVQEGRAGAKETYKTISQMYPTIAAKVIIALLENDDKKRIAKLEKLLLSYPDYGPILYYLSKEYSSSKVGKQTLREKRLEKEYLEKFIRTVENGKFLKYYVDKNIAATQVQDAQNRLKTIQKFIKFNGDIFYNPIIVRSFYINKNKVFFQFRVLEKAIEASYSLMKDNNYTKVKTPTLTRTTAKGTKIYYKGMLEFSGFPERINIFVKYKNAKNIENGPYHIVALEEYRKIKIQNINNKIDYLMETNGLGQDTKQKINTLREESTAKCLDNQNESSCLQVENIYNILLWDIRLNNLVHNCMKEKNDTCLVIKSFVENWNSIALKEKIHDIKKYMDSIISLYDESCKSGEIDACAILAEMYENGFNVGKDIKKAKELYIKACKGENGKSCFKTINTMGYNVFAYDLVTKKDLYNMSCDYGYTFGCAYTALKDKNLLKAKNFFEDLCNRKNLDACIELGKIYEKNSKKESKVSAKELYENVCMNGNAEGCFSLAQIYHYGKGIKVDNIKAEKFYRKACVLESKANSCGWLLGLWGELKKIQVER